MKRVVRGRRAFLQGAAGVSLALPFLESLPERSAWAAGANPTFALFICAVGGIVPAQFFPETPGPLTAEGLAAAGKATSNLSRHAENLLLLSGINWNTNVSADAHPEGMIAALTAAPPMGNSTSATGSGPSADVEIASRVHPELEPLTLYAGNIRNGYIAERLSYTQAGEVRAAVDNPYTLYLELIGLVDMGGTMTPEAEEAARRLLQSRNSIHDMVREDLTDLMQNPRLGSYDRQRLQQHFDAIRDIEVGMGGTSGEVMGQCAAAGLEVGELEALMDYAYDARLTTERDTRLHMSLVALAFACNHRRVATLQWGDPYDGTIYDVPSNARQWRFSYISHRAQSDAQVGNDATAEQAHIEIDALRMQTLAAGLDHFKARGLEDQSFVMWTNHYGDGPAHSFRNVPHIVWGSGGLFFKQAEHLNVGPVGNDVLLNTLISAAIQDTNDTVEDFGEGGVGGLLDVILA